MAVGRRVGSHAVGQAQSCPSRADIDAAAEGHPAIFTRVDGHIAVADSAALAAARDHAGTRQIPPGGKIDRDADGEPTGILRETAQSLVKVPPPSPEQRRRGLELALQDAFEHGVTSVQDFSDWDDFLVFEQMEREGRLPVRIAEWIPFAEPLELEKQQAAHHPATDRMLHTTMLKGFMDGSLGSRTAAMNAPYADDPGIQGFRATSRQSSMRWRLSARRLDSSWAFTPSGTARWRWRSMRMPRLKRRFDSLRCRLIHGASGPRSEMIPVKRVPPHDLRYRIEHSQVVSAGDFARYKTLGVIASMQPNHLLTDMAWAGQRPGAGAGEICLRVEIVSGCGRAAGIWHRLSG
jgi:predicted amidohydrolase YtcJ